MIRNDQQYKKCVASLAMFEQQLTEAKNRYKDEPIFLKLRSEQLEMHISDLKAAIVDYESAKEGKVEDIMHSFNPFSGKLEVAKALVKMRVAQGMTQEDLAQKVGTKQPAITRWESPNYDAYSLPELRRVASAMGWDIDVVFVKRGATEARLRP